MAGEDLRGKDPGLPPGQGPHRARPPPWTHPEGRAVINWFASRPRLEGNPGPGHGGPLSSAHAHFSSGRICPPSVTARSPGPCVDTLVHCRARSPDAGRVRNTPHGQGPSPPPPREQREGPVRLDAPAPCNSKGHTHPRRPLSLALGCLAHAAQGVGRESGSASR